MISFFVAGTPAPAGSKRTGVVLRKDASGRKVPALDPRTNLPRTFTTDDSGTRGKTWRADVREAATQAMDGRAPLSDDALSLEITFRVARRKGDYGTGRNAGLLKDSAPRLPTTQPDTTKLLRAIEDAMTGIVYRDDSQVVDIGVRKVYAEDGRTGAKVEVTKLEATRVHLFSSAIPLVTS